MNRALFLDRDGVLNQDKGYVFRFDEIVWIPETLEMIRMANQKNCKVIVLTNQSGVDRGMYKTEDVELLHKQMAEALVKHGCIVDDWFYCTEMQSDFRKPRPGMLYAAQKKYDINLEASFMVGDKSSDVFLTENEKKRPFTFIVKGNYSLDNLTESENVIVMDSHQAVLEELKKRL